MQTDAALHYGTEQRVARGGARRPVLRAFVDLDDAICAGRSATLSSSGTTAAESGTTAAAAMFWGLEALACFPGSAAQPCLSGLLTAA